MQKVLEDEYTESIKVIEDSFREFKNQLINAYNLVDSVIRGGNKIICCGNGGSAADAQHLAAELIIRFEKNREALPAISLTTDSSVLTACGNDFGFDNIFARQLSGIGKKSDLLIAISTSGHSENILRALQVASDLKIKTLLLTGLAFEEKKMEHEIDQVIKVQSYKTSRIQEVHVLIIHTLCKMIEERFECTE